MNTIILGDGPMGRAIERAWSERGGRPRVLGRPASGGHDPSVFRGVEVVFEASTGGSVHANVLAAAAGGCRRLVIATTGWDGNRELVDAILREHGAAAVWAPTFSLGVVILGRLVEAAASMFGALDDVDPFLVEWHRRAKRDRPSATARSLAARLMGAYASRTRIGGGAVGPGSVEELEIVSVRAGASPGMHLVGFDAPGETVELRVTARDRSAYAAGALAAADWLGAAPRASGLHAFEAIADDLLAERRAGAPAA
jgi:4-hydroxy-tetrahydrodipicolinate reductase